MKEKLLRAEAVAAMINTSVPTINIWYKWKKEHPTNKLAKLLPNYVQSGFRQTRYWKQCDIWKLIQFKNEIPHGRNGVLGDVTQKYNRKGKKNE